MLYSKAKYLILLWIDNIIVLRKCINIWNAVKKTFIPMNNTNAVWKPNKYHSNFTTYLI